MKCKQCLQPSLKTPEAIEHEHCLECYGAVIRINWYVLNFGKKKHLPNKFKKITWNTSIPNSIQIKTSPSCKPDDV